MPAVDAGAVRLRHPAGARRREGHLRRRGRPDRRRPALPLAHRLLAPGVGVPAGGRAAGAGRRLRLPLRLRGARPRGRPADPPPQAGDPARPAAADRGARPVEPQRRAGQFQRAAQPRPDGAGAAGGRRRWRRARRRPGPSWAEGSGLPEFTDAELVRAELEVLGLDASRHVVDFYKPFLAALGRGSGRGAAHLPQRRGGAGRRGEGGHPDPADPLRPAGGLRDPRRRHGLHRLDLLRGRAGPLRRDGVPLLAAGHPRGAAAHRPARGVAAGHRRLGAAGAARGVGGRRARGGARADGGAGGVHRAGDRRGGGVPRARGR